MTTPAITYLACFRIIINSASLKSLPLILSVWSFSATLSPVSSRGNSSSPQSKRSTHPPRRKPHPNNSTKSNNPVKTATSLSKSPATVLNSNTTSTKTYSSTPTKKTITDSKPKISLIICSTTPPLPLRSTFLSKSTKSTGPAPKLKSTANKVHSVSKIKSTILYSLLPKFLIVCPLNYPIYSSAAVSIFSAPLKILPEILLSNLSALVQEHQMYSESWLSKPKRKKTYNSHSYSTTSLQNTQICNWYSIPANSTVFSSFNCFLEKFKKSKKDNFHSFLSKKMKKSPIKLSQTLQLKMEKKHTCLHLIRKKSTYQSTNAKAKKGASSNWKFLRITTVQFTLESQRHKTLKKW